MTQLTGRGPRLRVSGQILQPKVEQSVVIGGLRVVVMDYGEDVWGKPAGEREGELVKRVEQEMRHDGVAEQKRRIIVRVVLVIVRGGVGAASPHGTAHGGGLTLNLAPHRPFGVALHPAAVLVPPALPCFGGA